MEPWRRSREDLTTDEAWAKLWAGRKIKKEAGRSGKILARQNQSHQRALPLIFAHLPLKKKYLRSWHMFADIAPPFERLIYRNCPDLKECMACIGPLI